MTDTSLFQTLLSRVDDAGRHGVNLSAHLMTSYALARRASGPVVECGVGSGFSTLALLAGTAEAGVSLDSYDTNPRAQDKWLQDAQNYETQQNYKEANSLYTSIIEVDNGNADALKGKNRTMEALRRQAAAPYNSGKEAMNLKNYVLAIEKFREVLDIISNYEDTADLLNKAIALREEQKQAAARNQDEGAGGGTASAAELDKINKGIVLYRQGKYAEAIAMWEKVPKTSSAYWSKAQKYIARAQLKK